MGEEVIDIDRERERERVRENRVGSRKKVFVKDRMLKRTKNVVFIYFTSLIIK